MNFTPENTHDLGDYQGDFGDFGDFGIWSHFRILELLLNLGLKFRVPTKNSWWFGSDPGIVRFCQQIPIDLFIFSKQLTLSFS